MQRTGAAHSSEFRLFETEEFRKALSKLGPSRFLPKKRDGPSLDNEIGRAHV